MPARGDHWCQGSAVVYRLEDLADDEVYRLFVETGDRMAKYLTVLQTTSDELGSYAWRSRELVLEGERHTAEIGDRLAQVLMILRWRRELADLEQERRFDETDWPDGES
jgi:hypothetical protein